MDDDTDMRSDTDECVSFGYLVRPQHLQSLWDARRFDGSTSGRLPYSSQAEAAIQCWRPRFGGARLIISPIQTGDDDEELRFADRLDILEDVLRTTWLEAINQSTRVLPLQMGGAERIRAPV